MTKAQVYKIMNGYGRVLFCLPFLIYPYGHFVYGPEVAKIVPPWIPWRLFWAYFCGANMLCAALAILFFKPLARLAALLLGIELFLFLLLIHAHFIFRPSEPWVRSLIPPEEGFSGELTNCFKDVGACGGAFIIAGTLSQAWYRQGRDNIFALGRTLLAISIIAFGIFHFVYPAYAPGIPPHRLADTFPIQGHNFWVYLSAIALLAAGISMLINWQTRLAAVMIGAIILVFALLAWVPRFFAQPSALTGNWLRALNLVGGLWILASACSRTEDSNHAADKFEPHKSAALEVH